MSTEEGKQLAETFGVNYFEVSAKENINIVDMFKSITREIMDRILSGDINDFISRRQIIKNKNDNERPLKKRCCWILIIFIHIFIEVSYHHFEISFIVVLTHLCECFALLLLEIIFIFSTSKFPYFDEN